MLKIYQVFIDRFSGNFSTDRSVNAFMGGNIEGVISHLEYIKGMGFNSILLSPFTTSTAYHGYHIENYYEVDPHFGSLEDVKSLIRKAHEIDLKLIFDFVPNHCSYKHPFFTDAQSRGEDSPYWDWFFIKKDGSYKMFLDFKELPKFNLRNSETAQYLITACKYWCQLGFDHVRVDHATGLPFKFLKELSQELKSVNSSTKIFGEVWAEGIKRHHFKNLSLKNRVHKYLFGIKQEQIQMDYIGVIDGVLDFEFMNTMIHHYTNGSQVSSNKTLTDDLAAHFKNYPADFELILMLDNHDTNRFMHYVRSEERLREAIGIMRQQGRSFSIYYGTEVAMGNKQNIFNSGGYADLQVREPFNTINKRGSWKL